MRASRGLLSAVLMVAGCGTTGGDSQPKVDAWFECNDRRIAYELTGGFGAHKSGVAVTCAEAGPQVALIRQETPDSERQVKTKAISSAEFNKLWDAIDSTGWRQLTDCDYLGLDGDPKYLILIGDHAASTKARCAAEGSATDKKLPFPYDNIVNELDLAAGGLR